MVSGVSPSDSLPILFSIRTYEPTKTGYRVLGLDLRKALPKTFGGENLQVPVLSPIGQTPEWLECWKASSDWIETDYPTGNQLWNLTWFMIRI